MVFKPDLFKGERPERIFAEDSADLERAVANAIAVTGGLQADQVSVTQADGRIVLSGSVGTHAEADRAEAAAIGAARGTAIDNRLRVEGPEPFAG
ncbi:BON domain-containing protein [Rhizobium sp. RU20A]|uniref:BON domain-containing protein n=1 Tax=Rhizobium sp. RU20A TaxID=1907412 RepID=UPI000954B545|nr:BON domain-containing protein [Rhizobium sp. RU20A]SIQ07976.1 BON domain-containing protein [Rhizobium sp. RU20A]